MAVVLRRAASGLDGEVADALGGPPDKHVNLAVHGAPQVARHPLGS
jgi:hypothetical protein